VNRFGVWLAVVLLLFHGCYFSADGVDFVPVSGTISFALHLEECKARHLSRYWCGVDVVRRVT
jgi:hypothetical protein